MSNQKRANSVIGDVIKNDIIDVLGLSDLPKEKQEEYRKLAIETVNNRTFSRITDMLLEKGAIEEFEKKDRDEKEIKEFLLKHGINLEELLAEEALIYKAQMKTVADLLDAGIDMQVKAA